MFYRQIHVGQVVDQLYQWLQIWWQCHWGLRQMALLFAHPVLTQLWALNQQLISQAVLGSSQSLLGRTLLGNFITIFDIKIDSFFAYWGHCTATNSHLK